MEKRIVSSKAKSKSAALPLDYLKMVTEIFNSNFKKELKQGVSFEAHGEIHPDELVLAITLSVEDSLASTTVYASTDFDPASKGIESIQELLGSSVDAIGSVFEHLRIEALTQTSLNDLENAPFDWTPISIEKKQIFVKIDKSNPKLDQMADDWLAQNDPHFAEMEKIEQEAMESLFFTGPKSTSKKPSGTSSGNTLH